MKNLLVTLLMLCLSVSGFAQADKLGNVGKALVKQKIVTPNISSKVYRANYALTNQAMSDFNQIYTQQVAAVLTDQNLTEAVRFQVLEQLKKQSAENLSRLNSQMEKEYAQWADVLLRERNPNFLPKKDSSIPGLLAQSPDPKKYPHMTLRFYREWLSLIPDYEELPEDFGVLVSALKKRLDAIDVDIKVQHAAFLKAKKELDAVDEFELKRFYRKQMRDASRRMVKLSKEAAQCVSDLVYMLNLYPSLFKESLTLLAAKIDNGLQTEFNTYLRSKINIPSQRAKSLVKRPLGFTTAPIPKEPELPHGITFTGHK